MKIYLALFVLIFEMSYAQVTLLSHLKKKETSDLDRVIKNKYIRVLTTKNPYDYYISNGSVKGVQYELIREFVKHLNQKYLKGNKLKIAFEMIPVDFDQLIPMLNAGYGDIIAVGLTKTKEREKLINFTAPFQRVDDVIVTRKELEKDDWRGKEFCEQTDSSYEAEVESHPKLVKVMKINPNLNAGNIMELVALKKCDYTLVNSFWAEAISLRFKNLTILKTPQFRKNVEISWGVRKNNSKLLTELNTFLPKIKMGTLIGNTIGQKYFFDLGRIQSDDFDLKKNRISKYDVLFKKYAKKYNFDWRLLSAVSLQESRFNQNLKNIYGAIGLFQIKEKTAKEKYINIFPIEGEKNTENNIHAGVKYLSWIKKAFDSESNIDDDNKLRFMLASYNAGPSRLKAAIEKTKELKLNPNIWFRNVEMGMLSLGHNEPVIYVSEINKHYVSYLLMGIN